MDLEHRMDRLEDKVIKVDERQQDLDKKFEAFMARIDMYIQNNDENMKAIRETVNRLDERMHNLTIATAIGVATIVIAIVLSR